MLDKKIFSSENAPAAVGPYSMGVKTGNLVFLSGQLGLNPATGEFVEGGIVEQTRQSLSNLENVLKSNGLGMENVVKTTVFLKDMSDFSKMNAVYGSFFKGDYPARSTIEVSALPKNGRIEIEAIAFLK
jgi:2-iminobutanoate/2-iminopropanoate deaminase